MMQVSKNLLLSVKLAFDVIDQKCIDSLIGCRTSITFSLTLILSPVVALFTEKMILNGPTLLAWSAWRQNQTAVLALETTQMEILAQRSQFLHFSFPFSGNNHLAAASAG